MITTNPDFKTLAAAVALAVLLTPAFGQTITWTGGGDGTSWNDPANWASGAVPGPTNDVVIAGGGPSTVIISSGGITVKSIQCAKALTISGGSLTLTAGPSLLHGALTMASGTELRTEGNTSVLTVTGPGDFNANWLKAGAGFEMSLPGVTNIGSCNLEANFASTIRFTNVTRVVLTQAVSWNAIGAGALLDPSAVTNVTVQPHSLTLLAISGGTVDLRRARFDDAQLRFVAQGAGSVLDLSQVSGELRGQGNCQLYAQDGGQVQMGPLFGISGFSVYLEGATSVLPLEQLVWVSDCYVQLLAATNNLVALRRIDRGTLELQSGAQVNAAAVTNIDGCNLTVNSASVSVLRLTNVARVVLNRGTAWNAFASGGLDLSGVTSVMVQPHSLSVGAYSGGKVDLRRARFDEAELRFVTQGAESVLNLSQVDGELRGQGNCQLYAEGGGQVQMGPLFGISGFSVYLAGAGSALPLDQVSRMSNCTVQLLGVTNNLPALTRVDNCTLGLQLGAQVSPASLTNIDGCNLNVYQNSVLRLPSLTQVVFSRAVEWNAWYADSLLDLSALTNVTLQSHSLKVRAMQGGKVDLQQVPDFAVSPVEVRADGAGSVVDLRKLSGFLSQQGSASSLTAQNGGVILLNEEAYLLANVAINIPPGNPVLPETLIASSTLTLYGKPWHSYWVEQRDASVADSPWVFAARVPLTSAFEDFAPAPPANAAFRVWEFVADPAILDLNRTGSGELQLVLYGAPLKRFEVLTTNSLPNLPASWPVWATTGPMTNSFRMFPAFAPPPHTKLFFISRNQ